MVRYISSEQLATTQSPPYPDLLPSAHSMSSFPPYKDNEDEEAANESVLPEPAPSTRNRPRGHWSLHVKLYIIVFLVNIAFTILSIAQTRIYERIFCHQWFDDHDPTQIPASGHVPEELCKIPQVQSQVSSLRGWMEFFEAAPTLIMAIPIGIFADLYGRQLFVRLELTVIVVQQIWITIVTFFPHQIPIHAVWLEGLLNFISGGKMVADMLFACVITDITPPEELATAFFRFTAIAQVTRVIGPAIAGALMKINAWWAVLVGIIGLMIMTAIVFTVPETLQKKHEYIEIASDDGEPQTTQPKLQTIKKTVIKAFKELGLVWTDWRLFFLVLLYPFRMLAAALSDLLMLYVSNRYGWTFGDAAFLFSLTGIAATIVLFCFLPWLSDFLDKRFDFNALKKNIVLSRMSLLIITFTFVIEGLAPNVALFLAGLIFETFGCGLASTLRAIAGCLVDSKDSGRVFSVLAMSETVSAMIAYPVTTALFNVGLEKGGGLWLGLPFFVTATMAAVAFVAMSLLRFER